MNLQQKYEMEKGSKIRIIRMDDNNGKDVAVHRMNGVVGVIDFIDSIGQIHLKGMDWQSIRRLMSLRC